MLDLLQFESEFKKGLEKKCIVFCGQDETLIKDYINEIVKKTISDDFKQLNYIKIDGTNFEVDGLINACETLPFMGDKKVVVLYRANFLSDNGDSKSNKLFENINSYIDKISPYTLLIMYYVFDNKREKPSKKLFKLDRKSCIVKADKIRGANLEQKVKQYFDDNNKEIGKIELRLFCNKLDNNMGIIENEVEKLCCYTMNKDITKQDIEDMFPQKSDEDIFDMVDFLAQKKADKAINIMNELIYKGEKIPYILYMVERQFKLLLNIILGLEAKKNKNTLIKELKLNPYICEKLISQSKRFTIKQIENAVDLCLDCEIKLKSSTINSKISMELLIINIITA
ncbi:MAG: polymerase subunit delta [Clostridiaceae bacterium]|nr:polymerase subunit delta [Clostridiaceae bacterium]